VKIALIADIHGNIWALDAVLEDLRVQKPDVILNLGDILHGALRPRDTYERLRAVHIDCTIAGNQDRERQDPDLPPEALAWLAGLPATASAHGVFLCHGTPASDTTYLLENVANGRALLKAESDILPLVAGISEPVIACGHTHVPRIVRLAATGQLIVNPGSVGLPAYSDDSPVRHVMETYTPHASYAIVENGFVSHRLVPYDWEAAARCAASRRPDWAHQLSTGRVASLRNEF
jgi:putative phosphoesterase